MPSKHSDRLTICCSVKRCFVEIIDLFVKMNSYKKLKGNDLFQINKNDSILITVNIFHCSKRQKGKTQVKPLSLLLDFVNCVAQMFSVYDYTYSFVFGVW